MYSFDDRIDIFYKYNQLYKQLKSETMAVPFIQLGQCGNQVGCSFFDKMFEEGTHASPAHQALLETFFKQQKNKKNYAKCLLIDMEPKVVQKNLNLKRAWRYDQQLSIVQQEGSGNNWAYGCKTHGPHVREDIINKLRKMFQQEDYIKCLFQIQSLAGGTGSGVGTYIMELLSQQFSNLQKYNICVMPHLSGQVTLQSYNAVLSLSSLYQESQGILILENDEVQKICNKQYKMQKPTLDDINSILGRQLASIFFPVVHKNIQKIYSSQQNGFDYSTDLVENVLYDPKYKLLNIKTSPNTPKNSESFNYDSWLSLQNDVKQNKLKTKGNILIARGPDHPETFSSTNNYLLDSHSFNKYHRSLTVIENNQHFIDPLEQIILRCNRMLLENAYVYQYQKYGVEKQHFVQSLAVMEGIQQWYTTM